MLLFNNIKNIISEIFLPRASFNNIENIILGIFLVHASLNTHKIPNTFAKLRLKIKFIVTAILVAYSFFTFQNIKMFVKM